MWLEPEEHRRFEQWAVSQWPLEACALVVDGRVIVSDNLHESPRDNFRVDPAVLLQHPDYQAVLHTHAVTQDQRRVHPASWPSRADLAGWMATQRPWGIASCDGEQISEFVWLDDQDRPPLVGRRFVMGVHDCYSIIRDWYWQQRQVDLPNFARGVDYWTDNDLYLHHYQSAGFRAVDLDDPQVGDVLLVSIHDRYQLNHGLIVTGDNQVLHHPYRGGQGLSQHDRLDRWLRLRCQLVRHESTDKYTKGIVDAQKDILPPDTRTNT